MVVPESPAISSNLDKPTDDREDRPMTPTSLFPDPQLATQHQHDLRTDAARARFARVARTFAPEQAELAFIRRLVLLRSTAPTRA
jgi:hypothetical protein